jgi:FMN-dependent NADH-azoreductase
MKILHIDSSITGAASISRKLSDAIVKRLSASADDVSAVYRDLANEPLPYISAAVIAKAMSDSETELAAKVLQEFMDADVIVIGAPMYNYGIPAQLKTWIDYLAVPGATFRYTERGSEGLAGGRKVYIASSRGGLYEHGTVAADREHQDSYLVSVLGFFGIDDVEMIRAQGVKVSPTHADRAIAAALEQIATIAPPSLPRVDIPELVDAL